MHTLDGGAEVGDYQYPGCLDSHNCQMYCYSTEGCSAFTHFDKTRDQRRWASCVTLKSSIQTCHIFLLVHGTARIMGHSD